MAKIKSAQKRARQNGKRQERNNVLRSSARTAVKKAQTAIEAGEADTAFAAVHRAELALDRAASKGAIHKNNAARRKSRITKAYNRTFAA